MRAEFSKDIHGTIWFTFASKVIARPGHDPVKEKEVRMQKMSDINEGKKKELENKLKDHVEKDAMLTKKDLSRKLDIRE